VTGSIAWKRGLFDTLKGYAALILGGGAAGLILYLLGTPPTIQTTTYLPSGTLTAFWSTVSPTSVLISAAAGFGGAILVSIHRSVLTAGVMIALALIPAATLIGLAVVSGDLLLAAQGFLRWVVDVALVFATSIIVFGWKQHFTHHRSMHL
jgi:hypothetical protein